MVTLGEQTTNAIAALSIIELAALFDGFESARLAYTAAALQPRCRGDQVRAVLDTEIDRCVCMMRTVVIEVVAREAATPADREASAEVLVRWGLAAGDWSDVGRGYAAAMAGDQAMPSSSGHS